MNSKKGFTLIELLVVVLIIGILAAIAVPQYQFSIIKSKTATMFPLIKSILEAEEVYYLNNGSYIGDVQALDITIPSKCNHIDFESYENANRTNGDMLACDNDFLIDNSARSNRVSLNYCPGKNNSWEDCSINRDFQIHFTGPNNPDFPNRKFCVVIGQSSLGQRFCNTFGENGDL